VPELGLELGLGTTWRCAVYTFNIHIRTCAFYGKVNEKFSQQVVLQKQYVITVRSPCYTAGHIWAL